MTLCYASMQGSRLIAAIMHRLHPPPAAAHLLPSLSSVNASRSALGYARQQHSSAKPPGNKDETHLIPGKQTYAYTSPGEMTVLLIIKRLIVFPRTSVSNSPFSPTAYTLATSVTNERARNCCLPQQEAKYTNTRTRARARARAHTHTHTHTLTHTDHTHKHTYSQPTPWIISWSLFACARTSSAIVGTEIQKAKMVRCNVVLVLAYLCVYAFVYVCVCAYVCVSVFVFGCMCVNVCICVRE